MSLGTLLIIVALVLAIVSIFVTQPHMLAFAVISLAVGVLIGSTPLIRPPQ